MAYREGVAVSTKHFGFSKVPVFSTKVTERFKISPHPIGNDGGAKWRKFSPIGESISYTAKQLNRSIRSRPSGKIGLVSELIMKCIQLLNVRARFAQLACGVEFASKSGNTTRNLRGGGFLSAPPCYAFRWLLRHSPMATGPGTPPQRIRPDCLAGFSFGWRTA